MMNLIKCCRLCVFLLAFPGYAYSDCEDDAGDVYVEYFNEFNGKLEAVELGTIQAFLERERGRVRAKQSSFYDSCIWSKVVKGEEVEPLYRSTDRLLMNVDSFLVIMGTAKDTDVLNAIKARYCGFVSRGVVDPLACESAP